MNLPTRAIVLAAGKGTRMKTDTPKMLLDINGKTMIESVVSALSIPEIENISLVVSQATKKYIYKVLGNKVEYIDQNEQHGTGHAVMCTEDSLKDFKGNVIVFVGDAPFITQDIVRELIHIHNRNRNTCTMYSSVFSDTIPPYGRIIRDDRGKFVKIIEERDCDEEQIKINEVNSSHYCFDSVKLFDALKKISNKNAQNEYYLTDVIGILIEANEKVEALPVEDPILTFGINTKEELNVKRIEFKKYLERNE